MSEGGEKMDPAPVGGTACLALELCLFPFHITDKKSKEIKDQTSTFS